MRTKANRVFSYLVVGIRGSKCRRNGAATG
jgi:hypothetical protein